MPNMVSAQMLPMNATPNADMTGSQSTSCPAMPIEHADAEDRRLAPTFVAGTDRLGGGRGNGGQAAVAGNTSDRTCGRA